MPTLPLPALVESLLFVADGPTQISQLAAALEVQPRQIEDALAELESSYASRGLSLQRAKDRVQLTTAPTVAAEVERFLGLESAQHLSKPSLETLAIVAYQQPVTRPQLESIRGVNCDGVIKSLLSKGLIEEVGRTEGPGRPILYGTTSTFLQHFGLSSLNQLPPLNVDTTLEPAPADSGEAVPVSEAEPSPQPVVNLTATGDDGQVL
ncbi:MAG: SMC-Scp complex subunit ScpB [Chloroflexi bacterium]|nr:SMC-Scp complex subunit ScpB [Chloroflexota bacterium]